MENNIEVLQKTKTRNTYDLAISLLHIQPKKIKTLIWKDASTSMLCLALFTIAKIWKQPKCTSTDTCIKKMKVKVAQSCPTLCNPVDCNPSRLLCLWDFPGKITGVGFHFLLQGIFLTQGSNSSLLLGRQILYHWTIDWIKEPGKSSSFSSLYLGIYKTHFINPDINREFIRW